MKRVIQRAAAAALMGALLLGQGVAAMAAEEYQYLQAFSGGDATFVAPYTGQYKVYCIGKSGDGGHSGGQYTWPNATSIGYSGGAGGGSGGIAISILTLQEGQSYPITINSSLTQFGSGGFYATAGQNGQNGDANKNSAAIGGAGGQGFGGNQSNETGHKGGDGGINGSTSPTGKNPEKGQVGGNGGMAGGDGGDHFSLYPYPRGGGGGGGARLPSQYCKYVSDECTSTYKAGKGCYFYHPGDQASMAYADPTPADEYPPFFTGVGMVVYGGGGGTGSSPGGNMYAGSNIVPGRPGSPGVVIIEKSSDSAPPTVTDVSVPASWGKTATATISATDDKTGVASYAVTTTNSVPGSWQASGSFTLYSNGTYYAWAKDAAGNVSSGRSFSVTTVDATAPSVNGVTVPGEWSKASATVTVAGTDSQSGNSSFAVTPVNSAPGGGWQSSASFTLSANGTYYAWAKDNAGNISSGRQFSVSRIDTAAPSVGAVTVPGEWGKTSDVSFAASDAQSGVAQYAVTTIASAPSSGWQKEKSFTLAENGSYYAWARDAVGNVSAGKRFEMERVDTEIPVIDTVTFTPDSTAVMIELSDVGSGVQGVYINDELKRGKKVSYAVPEDVLKLKLQAVDNVGNLGAVRLEIVPDVVKPTIDNVFFAADGSVATITASDKGSGGLRGVYINGEFFDGGSIIYRVPAGTKYLDLQAEDNAGNKSPMLKKRIPGWSEVLGEITVLPVKFSDGSTKATLTAKTTKPYSQIDGFYVNGVLINGSPATYMVPKGVKYLEVQAVDSDGDRSPVLTVRVPGWSETVQTLTITNVEFTGGKVLAWAKSTNADAPVKGITVNDSFVAGNPISSTLAKDARFVTLQAVDTAGDKSEPVVKRVPGWSDVLDTIAVTGVEFSSDGGAVTARADTTKQGAEISGIYVGGKLYEGNPVTCGVPSGAKTLTFQAQDSSGDLSPEITRRVPGWSEVIDGITVISVEISAHRSAAVAVAQAKTGAPAVAGIYINDTLIGGNPVKYAIPRGTKTLRVQAVNTDGDRSEIVTKEVFSDKQNNKKTTVSIAHPGWSNRKKDVRVRITAKNSGTGIDELTAKTDEDESWADVLDDGYITLTDNSTVTAVAVSGDGKETEKSRYIEWFDDVAPLVNASLEGGKVQIAASDKASGVSALYVNGQAFEANELDRGSLVYSIPDGVAKITVQAEDVAGNRSRTVELTVTTHEKFPEKPVAPLRTPSASVVKTPTTDIGSDEQSRDAESDARKAELQRLLEEKRKGRVELTADSTAEMTTLEDAELVPLANMEMEEYTMKEPRTAVLIACALAFWALAAIVILLILHKRKKDSAYDDAECDEE